MSDEGKEIAKAFSDLRNFFMSIAQLLSTASAQMNEHHWESKGNTSSAGGSASIQNPAQWIPSNVFQFFSNPGKKQFLAMVAVIFDDIYNPSILSEPIVTAGFVDYSEGGEVGNNNWRYDFSKMFLSLSEDMQFNGIMTEVPLDYVDPDNEWSIKQAFSLAVPLTSIDNADALKEKVVSPLLLKLREIS